MQCTMSFTAFCRSLLTVDLANDLSLSLIIITGCNPLSFIRQNTFSDLPTYLLLVILSGLERFIGKLAFIAD